TLAAPSRGWHNRGSGRSVVWLQPARIVHRGVRPASVITIGFVPACLIPQRSTRSTVGTTTAYHPPGGITWHRCSYTCALRHPGGHGRDDAWARSGQCAVRPAHG